MTLTKLCAPYFEPETWARGLALFHQGNVALTRTDDDGVSATAQPNGTTEFDVWLEFDPGKVEIEGVCTCPDYGTGKRCHHIWATLLAAEAVGWQEDLWDILDTLPVRHLRESMPPAAPVFMRKGRLLTSRLESPPPSPRRRVIPMRPRVAQPRPVNKAPTWQEQFQLIVKQTPKHGVPLQPPATVRPRQAVYVVNVARSLDVGGLYIVYHHQKQRQDGTFGKIKAQGVNRSDLHLYPEAMDQRLLQLLMGHPAHDPRPAYLRPTGQDAERHSYCFVAPVM